MNEKVGELVNLKNNIVQSIQEDENFLKAFQVLFDQKLT